MTILRKFLAGGVAVMLLPALAFAQEDEPAASGHILFGNPAPTVASGFYLTELLDKCNPEGNFQGYDGFWVELPEAAGMQVTLSPVGPTEPLSDFDLSFYDESCALIPGSSLAANFIGAPEVGVAPDDAHWIIVQFFFGFQGDFEITLAEAPEPEPTDSPSPSPSPTESPSPSPSPSPTDSPEPSPSPSEEPPDDDCGLLICP